MERPRKIRKIRTATDQELIDMIKREDYYLILKLHRNPTQRQAIRWNVMRTKWSILNQYGKL